MAPKVESAFRSGQIVAPLGESPEHTIPPPGQCNNVEADTLQIRKRIDQRRVRNIPAISHLDRETKLAKFITLSCRQLG